MKKNIILSMALIAGFSVSAQKHKNVSDEFTAPLGKEKTQSKMDLHDNGIRSGYTQNPVKGKKQALLWSEDFANGFTGWTVAGPQSNLVIHDYDGPSSIDASSIADAFSETPGNGFALFDFYGNLPNWTDDASFPAAATLTSPVIDLGTDTNVYISFNQALYFCCSVDWEAYLEVSTDGGATFPTRIVVNKGFDRNDAHWNLGFGFNFTFRLTDAVKADPSNVVLRFNWKGDVADQNDQYTPAYFWMIDDIKIHSVNKHHLRFAELSVPIQGNPDNTAPKHDIIYNTSESGKQGLMQVDQIVPISFDSNVENFGSETQTGVKLVIDILDDNGLVTSLESGTGDLEPDDTLSYETLNTPSWTPQGTGNYRIVYRAVTDSSSEPGAVMPSDTIRIYVTSNLHSLDFNRFNNDFGTDDLGDGSTVANMMYFPSECELRDVQLRFSTLSEPGGEVTIEVYDTAGFSQAAGFGSGALISKTFEVTQSMINANGAVAFDMEDDNGEMLDINPGAYFFAVTMYSNSGDNPIQLVNDQTFRQGGATWMNSTEGASQGWFSGYLNSSIFNAIWIRANLSPGIGLKENAIVNFNVYPNPSNGSNLKLEIEEDGEYKIEVVNMTGKIVYDSKVTVEAGVNHISNLNLSHLPKGVYLLSVSGKEGVRATKITLQ